MYLWLHPALAAAKLGPPSCTPQHPHPTAPIPRNYDINSNVVLEELFHFLLIAPLAFDDSEQFQKTLSINNIREIKPASSSFRRRRSASESIKKILLF